MNSPEVERIGSFEDRGWCSASIHTSPRNDDPIDNPEPPKTGEVGSFCSSAGTTVSAGLYIFDFVSNILVLKEYYYLDTSRTGFKPYHHQIVTEKRTGVFYAMLIIMVGGHIANAVAFKQAAIPANPSIMLTYFLPLIQFQRLVRGILSNCFRCCPNSNVEPPAVEALYTIISVATEGGPLFLLQFTFLAYLGNQRYPLTDGFWHPPLLLVLSLVASALSVAYNGGRAIMYQASLRWAILPNATGVVAGVYTLSALLLKCATLTSVVILLKIVLGVRPVSPVLTAATVLTATYFAVILFVPFIAFFAIVSKGTEATVGTTAVYAFAYMYLTVSMGPLYPMVGNARKRGNLRSSRFYGQFVLMVVLHALLDFVFVLVLYFMKLGPCNKWYNTNKANLVDTAFTCPTFATLLIFGITMGILSSGLFLFLLISKDYVFSSHKENLPNSVISNDEENQAIPNNAPPPN